MDGLNDPKNHTAIIDGLTAQIPRAAKAKVPNVITFFGSRRGCPTTRRSGTASPSSSA